MGTLFKQLNSKQSVLYSTVVNFDVELYGTYWFLVCVVSACELDASKFFY